MVVATADIAADGRRRATAAQVTIDDPQPGRIAAEDLGRPAGTVLVADAVKTEAAHAPIGIPCVGQGIDVCPGRKVREEGRIEDRHLPRVRQGGLRRGDGRQGRQIVQRGQLGPAGDALLHRAVDQHALGKLGPAVNDAVSDDLDIRQGLRAVGMCFRQRLNAHSRTAAGSSGTSTVRLCAAVSSAVRNVSSARCRSPPAQSRAPDTNNAQAGSVKRPNFRLVEPALKTRMLMALLQCTCSSLDDQSVLGWQFG